MDNYTDLCFLQDHSYVQDPGKTTTYTIYIVEYIAGYIVYALQNF